MNRRNDNNQRILAGKYNNIQVFSVSNTLYREYRNNQEEEGAEAYIDLSGIPGLRRYCQLVPAEAGLRAVCGFLNYQVPAFLGSVRQWRLAGSDSVTSESANTLRYALESVIKDLHDVRIVLVHSYPTQASVLGVSNEKITTLKIISDDDY